MRGCLVLAAAALVAGCAKPQPAAQARDSVSQRRTDSVIGASKLPGAQGVRRALRDQDSAAARNARLDSMQRADSTP